jgi:hypothetical protein
MARQARSRAEYAGWYPTVPPARWQLAEAVRRMVLRQLRHGSPAWEPGPRILSDRHFEFQGASPAGTPQASDVEWRRRVPLDQASSGPTDAVEGSH